ncbi:MAG: AarF/UbiB family protein [Candidatus Riflebacteria bacterium]|nr:AarF/UbiB family protein [Candidatus Riflebacteria bacterium]
MNWMPLLETLDLNGLIPECYAKWKPLVKNGLSWFLGRLSEERQKEILDDLLKLGFFASAANKFAAVLRRCPTLHKLGQILARDRRLSSELRNSLQQLESMPARMSVEEIRSILARENIDLDGITLGEKPLAEASVAVVMPFIFSDAAGQKIEGVFKIVRPEAEKALETELKLWPELGKELEAICKRLELPVLEFAGPLADASLLVADEVRLDREQLHIRRATELYKDFPEIALPQLLPWCTSRVTAMTRIIGKTIAEAMRTGPFSEEHKTRIAEKIIDGLIAKPFWTAGAWAIFHGDPHGGNIFYDEQGRIVPIDWSLAVELPENDRINLLQLLTGGMRMDKTAIADALSKLGIASDRNRIQQTGKWALEQIRAGNFPGFSWCLSVLDHAVEFGGLKLRAELALFRKALFALISLVEDIAPGISTDSVVAGSGLVKLATELPMRVVSDPFSCKWSNQISTAELINVLAGLPAATSRFWYGRWSDAMQRSFL